MSVRVGSAFLDVEADFSKFDRQVSRQTGPLNKQFSNLGSQLGRQFARGAVVAGKAAGVTLAGGLVFAGKKAADFEAQIDSLGATADANARQMERLRRQALRAGADTKFSALEAAQAQTELAKGGLKVAQIARGGLRSALALASAGELDLALAGETAVNAMKLFKLRGKDAMQVADGLATAANVTTAGVSDFALSLAQGGSAAKAAGLDFQETVAALEALASMGIRGSDAGTSLKAALTQMASPSTAAAKAAKKLNIEFFDQQGNIKSLVALSGHLRDRLGGLTKQQRLDAAATLVGTDGMRALLALYDAGPEKMARFERGLQKHGSAARVAAEKQDNLKGSVEELSGSFETLGISVGDQAIPQIRTAAEEVTDLTNRISRIVQRDDLDLGEKLDRIFEVTKVEAGPWVDKLERAVAEADIPERIGDGISAATPFLAEKFAQAAPKAANAFFEAWRESDVWGKLVIGGVLLNRMGGLAAFREVGRRTGGAWGVGMAEGMAATGPAGALSGRMGGGRGGTGSQVGPHSRALGLIYPGARSGAPTSQLGQRSYALGRLGDGIRNQATKIAPQVREIGKGVLGVALVAGIADAVTTPGQGLSLGDRLQRGLSTGTLGLVPDVNEIDERFAAIADRIKNWRSSGLLKLSDPGDPDNSLIREKDLGDFTARQRRMLDGMAQLRNTANRMFGPGERLIDEAWADPRRATGQLRSLMNEFGRMKQGSVLSVKELRQVTSSNFAAIAGTMGVNSKRGRAAVEQNFQLGLRSIKGFMRDGTLSTEQGSKEIARLLKVHSAAGKDSLKRNYKEARDFIARTMRNSKGITDEGMQAIRKIFADELRLYGLSDEAVKFRLQGKEQSGKTIGAPLVGKQRGGLLELAKGAVVPGRGTGDKVPLHIGGKLAAMVESGELVSVANRKATAALMRVNKAVPRFARGGMIDPGWDPGDERIAAAISGRVGGWAKRYRADMTAGYDPGGGHVSPGHNVTGTATDMVPLGGDWDLFEKGLRALANAGLKVLYGSNGIGVPWPDHGRGNHAHIEWGDAAGLPSFSPKLKRILIAGPGSPLKAVAQGALDKTSRAAQQRLRALVGAGFADGTGGVSAAGGEYDKAALKALWIRAGGDPGMADLMAAIALAESGGDPNIVNSIGATGLWQIHPGGAQYLNPLTNARTAVSKLGSQGLAAWEAYTNGRYRQFLQQGGLVAMLQRGGLAGMLNRTANIVGGLNKKGGRFPAKLRSKRLQAFLERVKDIGLPDQLQKNLTRYENESGVFAEYAQRAGQLSTDGPDGSQVLGVVNGLNEQQWLEKQLEAEFKLRNALIRAHDVVVAKRERVTKLIEQAQQRLRAIAETIRAQAKTRRDLNAQLEKAQKKPRQNAALIKDLKGKIKTVDQAQGVNTRLRNVLNDRMLPALGKQRTGLNTARGEFLESLDQVQGIGSPMGRLNSLPPLGVLGGRIFEVQMRLGELGKQPNITDNTDDGGRGDMLEQLLREANLRTAVSQAQYQVLRDMPPYGGSFAAGGTVPGPVGAPRTIIAHGGETITPEGGVGRGGVKVDLHFANGMEWLRQFVRVEVRDETRKAAAGAGLGLPSRGGGLLGG